MGYTRILTAKQPCEWPRWPSHMEKQASLPPYLCETSMVLTLQQPKAMHAFEVVKNSCVLPFPDLVTKICTAIYTFPGNCKFLSHERMGAGLLSLLFPSGFILCCLGLRHTERLYGAQFWGGVPECSHYYATLF